MAGKPNILFILVDQLRMPPSQANLTPRLAELNQVLGFDPTMKDDNPFVPFLPAFRRLRSQPGNPLPKGMETGALHRWPPLRRRQQRPQRL